MSWLRRHRAWVAFGLVVVAVAVLRVVFAPADSATDIPHDPDNPGRDGAQAVARVLADEGIEVDVARGAAAFEAAEVGPDTTVVVTSAEQLGSSTVTRLLAQPASRIVVVGPPPQVLEELAPDVSPWPTDDPGRIRAACADPLLRDLRIEVDSLDAYANAGDGCFRTDGRWALARVGRVTLLGAAEALTNDQVTRADNAALALRLLGQEPRLVWYVPDARDLPAEDAVTLGSLLPPYVVPGVLVVGFAVLGLMLWRGRRFGPLVTEPLPVAVKAIETTQSRGRLYLKVNDRAHAADVLRTAARNRLTRQLRLARDLAGRPEELAREVARISGRPLAEVTALLSPHTAPPGTDQDLVGLAHELDRLDREVSPQP